MGPRNRPFLSTACTLPSFAHVPSSVFDPAALDALQEAFEDAWSEVLSDPIIRTNEQTVRDLIARRIMDAAVDQGIRDPVRIKAYALRVFKSGREPPSSSCAGLSRQSQSTA